MGVVIRHRRERRALRDMMTVRYQDGWWFVVPAGSTVPADRCHLGGPWRERADAKEDLHRHAHSLWQDAWNTVRYGNPGSNDAYAVPTPVTPAGANALTYGSCEPPVLPATATPARLLDAIAQMRETYLGGEEARDHLQAEIARQKAAVLAKMRAEF